MVKSNLANLIVSFIFLLALVKSEPTWINYDHENEYVEYAYTGEEQKHAFVLEFKEGKSIPYYIKVEVNSTDDSPAPLLCFSNNDQNCIEREQLVKNPVGKSVFMWLKREQFESDELYAVVECPEPNCKYIISFKGDQTAIFRPNFVYSYLVGINNKEMTFDILGPEKNIWVTVTLEGSSKAKLNVEHQYDQYSHRTVKGMTFYVDGDDEINASSLAQITINNAEVGEYLTLSVHIVNDTDSEKLGVGPDNYILPNGPEITGYLELEKLNEECFPLDLGDEKYKSMEKLYVTGRIYTQNGWFFLENEKREYLPETDLEILNGQLSYVMKNNGKLNYLCFELPIEESIKQTQMVFAFSITEPTKLNNLYNYYPPQLTGMIYRRIIPKGSIAFFSGTKNDGSAKKYDYNLYQIKGYSRLYIGECRTYPDCHYEPDTLYNLIEPKNTNQMTIWTTTDDKSSAIGTVKYVMVVKCEDDDNQNNGYCEFETSIFSKGQSVDLVENEKFYRFAVKGEKGTFIADIQSGRQIQRITFDIMIFSGDINFDFSKSKAKLRVGDEEVDIIYKEIKRINADPSVFSIDRNGRAKTAYREVSDIIVVGSNVFPDLDNPINMTDKLSVACVLAHEYYGHRSMRDEYLKEEVDTTNSSLDEFKASFLAYKNTPNLTEEEREMLLYQAYETAKNGKLENEIKICQEIIRQNDRTIFESKDSDE